MSHVIDDREMLCFNDLKALLKERLDAEKAPTAAGRIERLAHLRLHFFTHCAQFKDVYQGVNALDAAGALGAAANH